jgi:hypothetical protein
MLAGSKPAASWLDVFPGTSVAVLEAHAMDYIHADAVTSMMGRRQKSLQDSLRTLEVSVGEQSTGAMRREHRKGNLSQLLESGVPKSPETPALSPLNRP